MTMGQYWLSFQIDLKCLQIVATDCCFFFNLMEFSATDLKINLMEFSTD